MTVFDVHTTTLLPELVSAGLSYRDEDGSVVEYAHLDHGATTPAFAAVAQEVAAAAVTYSSVHRGAGFASRVTSSRYEQARESVADFVGAREDDQVVFTRNTTDSFNLLARALPEGTKVFVFASEHHAALLPWGDALRLPVPHSHDEAIDLLDQALRNHPAEHRLVVATGASNVTGEHWPIERIAALAHEHGARFALDGAQVVPHRRVDISALGIDWIAFSGHKIYAPFGAGVLVGRSDWLDAADPYLAGGGASAHVGVDTTEWACGPARHEAGSPNVLGAVALATACDLIAEHERAIADHEQALRIRLLVGLADIEGVHVHTLFGGGEGAPVASITVDGYDSGEVARILGDDHGIGVRDGKFCAHLLVDDLLSEHEQDSAVRISAGLGTTPQHIDRLLSALRAL
ncbi:cysteine desulfurase [Janibacter sp. Soil728]|uniref:aminotransferase class V-fold PLP-dependent enzyme n=1 Tax=Janibacter sp. Soil728 TaxID=1736393 RepID=UPI0006F37268|nr:aminotransferase class V-fold PLP-dependent enzyme [Janibacter sp. Soil728]KRE37874.1 cysteine desulfurase [Janibacter sp. Soil728]